MEQRYTAHNNVTGDLLVSRANSEAYKEGYEAIFGKSEAVRKAFKQQHEALYYEGWRVDRWDEKWVDGFGEIVKSDGHVIVYLTNKHKQPQYETFAYVKIS